MKRKISYGKRKYARRRYGARKRLRRTYKRRTVNVNRSLQPFGQRYLCKLKYSDNFIINPLSPVIPYQLRLNSIFDPNLTGVGHQPYGFDQLALLYNRYRVYACKWNLRFQTYTAGVNYYLCAFPSNDPPSSISNFDDIREKPRSKYVMQMSGNTPVTLRGKISLPSLTGRTKSQYMADDRYQATFTNDPQEVMLLNIFAFNAGSLTSQPNGLCTAELTYYIECFDPNVLAQS